MGHFRRSSLGVAIAVLAGCAGATSGRAAPGSAAPALQPSLPQLVVPGRQPVFRWPAAGEAAVAVAGVGLVGESPVDRRVPIASLTKMMTAIVVLRDHPLALGHTGPQVTISPWDVLDWQQDVQAGDSVVEVTAGEVMTEFQLLEALLIPSGDNIADRLAIWDAGSIDAFVAKMNRTAASFGLRSTHYADPSGVDPRSSSSAGDQALVASILMADPVVRRIVARRRINLPVVGVIPNRNPALSVDGIVGIKGGYSSHALNCLATAAFRVRHAALVVSVALGQADRLAPARIDAQLLETATKVLRRFRLVAPGAIAGTLAASRSGPGVDLVAPLTPVRAVVWPGLLLSESIAAEPHTSAHALRSARPGSVAGVLTVSAPWGVLARIPLRVAPPAAPGAPASGAG